MADDLFFILHAFIPWLANAGFAVFDSFGRAIADTRHAVSAA